MKLVILLNQLRNHVDFAVGVARLQRVVLDVAQCNDIELANMRDQVDWIEAELDGTHTGLRVRQYDCLANRNLMSTTGKKTLQYFDRLAQLSSWTTASSVSDRNPLLVKIARSVIFVAKPIGPVVVDQPL